MEQGSVPFRHVGDDAWLRANGLFVAEGRLVVTRLLQSPNWRMQELLLTPARHAGLRDILERVDPSRRPNVQVVDALHFSDLAGFNFHQGCLGLAERPATPLWTTLALEDLSPGPIVVLEHVRDPDNVGSIFRSALALGARALLVGPGCADPLYRKTVRTSMAAVLALPFGSAEPWPVMLRDLCAHGRLIVATTPDASAEPLPDAALSLRELQIALVVGSEADGLSAEVLSLANRRVRVPIVPGVDSLNVATATAITLYALTTSS